MEESVNKKMSKKQKATVAATVALIGALLVSGSLAYFTDRVDTQAQVSVTDNAVNIEPTPDPEAIPDDPTKDPEKYEDPTPDDPTDDLTNWWAWLNSVAKGNFNPGDKMDLSFKLANKGNLDVKVRETFVITSSKPLTFDEFNRGKEFTLCTGYEDYTYGGVAASEYAGMTFTKLSDTQYKVTVDGSELAASDSAAKDYFIVFAPTADNTWQKATCTVDYVVEAMQANGDWATVATAELNLNGHTVNAVPAS